MKRFLLLLAITMATVCSLQAAHVSETAARQVADKFLSSRLHKSPAHGSPSTLRLAYRAENERFYIYDRGTNGGFVVVAGDDRLPQVLGYGDKGDFTTTALPPAVQYWMNELNRQIAYLQSHDDASVHHPAKRAAAVAPLMTTVWDQSEPYNNLCPTYISSNGDTLRAVTGCVATATAQIMNFHKWPDVGQGSHSYLCEVNNTTPTELSADFSQSVYQWDLMLDEYNEGSDEASCEAVAKLMSDVGISMDMNYGSSSGAQESEAMLALQRYFKYSPKCYLLNRDYFTAQEWDQLLIDEISARRPILYCGYDLSTNGGGHAFVFDGFNTDGYFHVNWGWGGYYDGYYVASVLNPGTSNFKYMQDGMFGVVPEPQGDAVDDVLYIRTHLTPKATTVPLGEETAFAMDDFMAQGNSLDTAGYDDFNGYRVSYALIPMSLGVYDKNGVERQSMKFDRKQVLEGRWWSREEPIMMTLPSSLEDGEYTIKLSYSMDAGNNYDHQVFDFSGKEMYVQMLVKSDTAYLTDCFLWNTYSIDSFVLPPTIRINQVINVEVNMSNPAWGPEDGPTGNVYLALLNNDDASVAAIGEPCEVMIAGRSSKTYQMQIKAPADWGLYHLALFDESGNQMIRVDDFWMSSGDVYSETVFVLPICDELVEDFESMTANSSTSDKNVQGNFTTWNFTKSGVRAPGEGRCNGANAIMMKKPSSFATASPLSHNFFMGQYTAFNPSTTASKFTMEYSVDGGATWLKAYTLDHEDAAEVPEKSQRIIRWSLDVDDSQEVYFRVAMVGGGTASNYVDDFILYYKDITNVGDVNADGVVNIADINVLINLILSDKSSQEGDVNGDGVVNIADINMVIDQILR